MTNPADTPVATPAALEARLDALQAAHLADPCPPWPVRRERLRRLSQVLLDNRAGIKEAISADFGHRSHHETDLLEIFPSLQGLRHAVRHGKDWMRERRAGVSPWFMPASASVLPQPLGVVGIIVPWNYPLFLLLGPLTAALAAGNRAMVKLSEFTPRFAALMAELLPRALGEDVVQVVQGGPEVAEAFSRLPFGHLLFTGSTAVGRRVMAAAAERLVPVTLELGGKSPAIVSAETSRDAARLENAVRRILVGKLLNAGQTCIAPDYVLLPRAAMPRFAELARAIVAEQYPGGLASPDYTGIANDKHLHRLQGLVAEAVSRGARAEVVMAAPPSVGTGASPRKLPLTLLAGCPPEALAMRAEIFGPVLPLVACESLEEAIAFVNDRPHPLALYLFDDSPRRQAQVLRSTLAGGVCVNDTLLHVAQDELPFGGVGASGMGHYHGRHGFEAMSKLKPVFRQSRLNAVGLMSPPYGRLVGWLLKLMLRRGG